MIVLFSTFTGLCFVLLHLNHSVLHAVQNKAAMASAEGPKLLDQKTAKMVSLNQRVEADHKQTTQQRSQNLIQGHLRWKEHGFDDSKWDLIGAESN